MDEKESERLFPKTWKIIREIYLENKKKDD